jgi:hypothetical protein
LRHDQTAALLAAMQAQSRPVKPHALGVIGKDHLARRLEAVGCEMKSFKYSKVMVKSDPAQPQVIETAFAWRGEKAEDRRRFVTGVNWSPAVGNPFRQIGPAGQSLDTYLAQKRMTIDEPVIIVLHTACPKVQYTDRGKSAVVVGGGEEE